MFVLLARHANIGVILRRGPTQMVARIYPHKCDLSPNGKLLVYFGGKFRASDVGIRLRVDCCQPSTLLDGSGIVDKGTVLIATCGGRNHPKHPAGPLLRRTPRFIRSALGRFGISTVGWLRPRVGVFSREN
jgi:hypothetical protein